MTSRLGSGAPNRSKRTICFWPGASVKIGGVARNLKGHGLDEGISTRLLVYAATLIKDGVEPRDACRMALVRPITDDADIRETLDHAIDATFA